MPPGTFALSVTISTVPILEKVIVFTNNKTNNSMIKTNIALLLDERAMVKTILGLIFHRDYSTKIQDVCQKKEKTTIDKTHLKFDFINGSLANDITMKIVLTLNGSKRNPIRY